MIVENSFRWDACPLCKSEDIRLIGEIDYRKPIQFSSHLISLTNPPELAICNECGSWFTQNIVSEETTLKLYAAGNSDQKWPRKKSFEFTKSKKIIERLSRYFKSGKKVLDIGANTGDLLDYAMLKGCKTFAVEPSESSRKLLKQKSHLAYEALDHVAEKFDVITAFDLVEHLHDLNDFVCKVSDLLVDGGVLIILTGDVKSLSARISKNRWWYLKEPVHIVFPSMKFFSKYSGFEIISVDHTYASIGYEKKFIISLMKLVGKMILKGGYDGLSSMGPDHILVTLKSKNRVLSE